MHDLKIAAQQGDGFAEFNDGNSLHNDEGAGIDFRGSEHELRRATRRESGDAQFNSRRSLSKSWQMLHHSIRYCDES
jgi:hypothetical protein